MRKKYSNLSRRNAQKKGGRKKHLRKNSFIANFVKYGFKVYRFLNFIYDIYLFMKESELLSLLREFIEKHNS